MTDACRLKDCGHRMMGRVRGLWKVKRASEGEG